MSWHRVLVFFSFYLVKCSFFSLFCTTRLVNKVVCVAGWKHGSAGKMVQIARSVSFCTICRELAKLGEYKHARRRSAVFNTSAINVRFITTWRTVSVGRRAWRLRTHMSCRTSKRSLLQLLKRRRTEHLSVDNKPRRHQWSIFILFRRFNKFSGGTFNYPTNDDFFLFQIIPYTNTSVIFCYFTTNLLPSVGLPCTSRWPTGTDSFAIFGVT